ncbi:2-succinyl-5-enolpyruvyl-6-hydroxy-3-cyclohexene-1-carboxylic-acid synthase [Vibrio sinensis]|uniref:2-succinyl-5-enolpyruvyl-6-hydroxy-3-cyclohexene-1-carboxylate synthase n=1 Tax=Vibrio sinensis TaxID=2302434 RepID=A0A3A6QGJ2_9VIBR|nr:2-succinyl-5-enolpyruvyl-6-hydroxy-3-cyclohexene-1-carboxylic-acid synthase [Vibrio sinensis]RJX72000.1 2-succinyl-5-enolpyruvyl-6-hydroxy-3-cyclohexene-1-carboxylic-acid synthase [Vibrio sinensis]
MNHVAVNHAVVNRIWSQVILEELTRFGVSDICIAPGSRSTPLTLEADANINLTMHTHFDERGLGFLALGLAKASQKPVAIVVTSGTAVANLLPAIAEAKLTGERLVVLTADRPVELLSCGANQAILQQGIFSHHVTANLDLPSPSLDVPLKWLLTSIDHVMHQQRVNGCAIHINCPFPEPLYSGESKVIYQSYIDAVNPWWQQDKIYSRQTMPTLAIDLSDVDCSKRGAILLGSVTLEDARLALQLATQLGWPILCDPQSGVSSDWAYYDVWLQNESYRQQFDQCELVIQLGSRIVSKRLNQWIQSQVEKGDVDYHYVAPSRDRNNQDHLPQNHHVAVISEWVAQGLGLNLTSAMTGWAEPLQKQLAPMRTLIHQQSQHSLSEIALATLTDTLPSDVQVFVGNSLFVRLLDMFGTWDGREVYSNRGASGIDGLIATASGVIQAKQQATAIYIGDTSLLYDVNSLALLTHIKTPVVVIVTNNDGGAIFDLLPVPAEQKQALYQMPHGFDFEHAAKQFQLSYTKPLSISDYVDCIEQHFTSGSGALVIEVQTPPEQASQQLKALVQKLHAL